MKNVAPSVKTAPSTTYKNAPSKHKTRQMRHYASHQKPETRNQKPETRNQKPETSNQKPATSHLHPLSEVRLSQLFPVPKESRATLISRVGSPGPADFACQTQPQRPREFAGPARRSQGQSAKDDPCVVFSSMAMQMQKVTTIIRQ
jgi:hypothetical protein